MSRTVKRQPIYHNLQGRKHNLVSENHVKIFLILIKKAMDKALSPDELKDMYYDLTGQDIKVYLYNEIIHSKNLDDLFQGGHYFIIWYPWTDRMGHYTCLIHNTKGYFYYDSLGFRPDYYKQTTPYRGKLYKEPYNSLINLLLKKGQKNLIDYNEHKQQSDDTSTCGRFCLVRCFLWRFTNDGFNDLLNDMDVYNDTYHDKLIYNLTKEA